MTTSHDEEVKNFVLQEAPQDTHEPREVFTQLAADLGLIRPNDKVDQNMVDFASALVERCAVTVDGYADARNDTSAAERIRSVLGQA